MTRTKARVCGDKQRHDDKTSAEQHRHHLIRNGASPRRINVYRCPVCGGWHVGHWPRRRR